MTAESLQLVLLSIAALFSSALTATVGLGGGVLLLMILLTVFPPILAIPIHGCVQMFANFSRAGFGFSHIQWRLVRYFSLGALGGLLIGTWSLDRIPFEFMPLLLAVVILATTWWPSKARMDRTQPPATRIHGLMFAGLGCLQTTLSFFMGATGPLAQPLLMRQGLDKHAVVVTAGALVCIMHFLKVTGFIFGGVDLSPNLATIVMLSFCVVGGSFMGTRLRKRLDQKWVFRIARGLITLLALRMIYTTLLTLNSL